ncbi:Colicin I receptor precursor [Bacteroidales bacterium Barb6]|nr:Colicin I receptor precursor [Bacteroidales bacterium Barb6]
MYHCGRDTKFCVSTVCGNLPKSLHIAIALRRYSLFFCAITNKKNSVMGNKQYAAAGLCLLLSISQGVKAGEDGVQEEDSVRYFTTEEVVITASPKETNDLRKLPGSVSVLSPQLIAGRQIESLKDISASVPNLYMPAYGAKLTSAVYIRGIGARSSGQTVGLYVDNIPYLDKSTFDFELTDIQRIEVLRGPQGTLYGRNAMGGIINVRTLSPFDFQGTKLSVSGGNYGLLKAKASHYRKLSDKLALSAGGYYDRSDGFFTNEYTGRKADNEESAGGRFKLDGRIAPRFTAAYSFTFDYTSQGAFPYGKYDRANDKVLPVAINDPSSYNRRMTANNLQLEYRTDKIVLTSTTGHQWFDDNMQMDQDYDTIAKFTLAQKQLQRAFSQEIAVKSLTTGNYQWSSGLYGFHNDLRANAPVTFKKDGIGMLQKVFTTLKEENPKMPSISVTDEELFIPGRFETPSYGAALFHQSTLNNLFTGGLSLTAGLRLDYEKQRMGYDSKAKMSLGMSMNPAAPPADISGMYEPSVMDESISQDFLQLLPKASLKYEWADGTFAYLSAAKGYKSGGYNIQMSADVMQSQMQYDIMQKFSPQLAVEPSPVKEVMAYKPEMSWSYEAGIRSGLFDNRLTAELTFFYMDIADIQLTKFTASGNGRILANAGKAESYGAELSLHARLADGLTANANYGYTHATFRNYDNGREDFKGKRIPYTPAHTLSLGLQYTKLWHNAAIDQFTASAWCNGAGQIYWTEQNTLSQPFYGLLNLKAGIRKGIVSLNLWGRNLTDTGYSMFYFETSDNAFMQAGRPLQAGAEVAVTF